MQRYNRPCNNHRTTWEVRVGLADHVANHHTPAVTNYPETGRRPWHVFLQACDHYSSEGGQGSGRLAALSQCNRFSLNQQFDCGHETNALEPWCGSACCQRCMDHWARRALRVARHSWPGKVWTVSLPLGRSGGFTPISHEQVKALRAAWQNLVNAMARSPDVPGLERRPRAIISPDGLLLLAHNTASTPEEQHRQEQAVTARATLGGLWSLSAQLVSREQAIHHYQQACLLETRRFQAAVRACLEGQLHAPPLEQLIRHVRETGRRPESPGGRGAIPAGPPPARVQWKALPHCPNHGPICSSTGLVTRDLTRSGAITSRESLETLADGAGRQAIHWLLTRVATRARPQRTISAVLRRTG